MKTIIAGSRYITNYTLVADAVRGSRIPITEVVSGCAKGVDTLGEQWASWNKIPLKKFPADWSKHGRAAGPIRNQEMADYADALIAIPSESSVGTKDMIHKARKAGLSVFVAEPGG